MQTWDRATTALALLAIDPGLGGLVIRAHCGPARDALIDAAGALPLPATRLHPALAEEALDGGIDLAETLKSGTLSETRGLLHQGPRTLILAMAERCTPYLAARLSAALDGGGKHVLLALDEGGDDEHLPDALRDRLAFHVDLSDVSLRDLAPAGALPDAGDTLSVSVPEGLTAQLTILAARLGIRSLRAVGFALRTARALALRAGREIITEEDVETAVALVFAHRATQIPDDSQPELPEPEQETTDSVSNPEEMLQSIPDEILLNAIKSALPEGLLAQLSQDTAQRGATGSGSGARIKGNRRGRPLPARRSQRDANARVDLIATLRNAVPWQTMRKQAQPDQSGALIRPDDIARKRYQIHSDRLLIFAVDASGSAALARLGEAKGAVELLLAEAYARRDHVALIGFRGTHAETLLTPTRSLIQTKRRLAEMPGGGATPLAAGLAAARDMALHARRKGLTPTLVLLTDGRCNITLDGTADRAQANADATAQAQMLQADRVDAIVIDASNRPERALQSLSKAIGGHYVALPRADARRLSDAVSAHLDA